MADIGSDWNFDSAPNQDFIETGRQARLCAHYHRTLKDEGLSEYEACELSKEWMAMGFEAGKDED